VLALQSEDRKYRGLRTPKTDVRRSLGHPLAELDILGISLNVQNQPGTMNFSTLGLDSNLPGHPEH
jgi:hypothetical protein